MLFAGFSSIYGWGINNPLCGCLWIAPTRLRHCLAVYGFLYFHFPMPLLYLGLLLFYALLYSITNFARFSLIFRPYTPLLRLRICRMKFEYIFKLIVLIHYICMSRICPFCFCYNYDNFMIKMRLNILYILLF